MARPDINIGGVFPLHDRRALAAAVPGSIWDGWIQGAARVHCFRNARSALRYALVEIQPAHIWLPAYACSEFRQAVQGLVIPVSFYPSDSSLQPDVRFLRRAMKPRDVVVGINFFGRPLGEVWRRLVDSRPDVTWIEDCAQSADPGTHFARLRLYSPRKLLGVPDGGILVDMDARLSEPRLRPGSSAVLQHPSLLRERDTAGRNNETWYRAFRRAESAMTVSDIRMSAFSQAVLQGTPLEALTVPRIQNYGVLREGLSQYSLFPDTSLEWAPLGFPMLIDRANELCEKLAQSRVFAPRHWTELATASPPACERILSRRMLTLPCDQRYDGDDMHRVVRMVKEFAA